MANLIWVVPTQPGKVAVAEVNPTHPGGQAFVYWPVGQDDQPQPVRVAATPTVRAVLGSGGLQQVISPESESPDTNVQKEMAIGELMKIKGIGPALANIFYDKGIVGLQRLVDQDKESLESLASELGRSITQLLEWQAAAHDRLTGGD